MPAFPSHRRAQQPAEAPDECYRCGYPLLGIEDEHACPECGLLARRSRRTTDELHNTRPRWLARISRGANLILLSILIAAVWPFMWGMLVEGFYWRWMRTPLGFMLPMIGLDVAAILLLLGAWLLTSREGYPPADQADRRLRLALRLSATVPLFAVLTGNLRAWSVYRIGIRGPFLSDWEILELIIWILCSIGLIPLPLLLFAQLRGLANRAQRPPR
ncbi:MAG TPA: hypothetical protein VGR35_17820 [Tepidisphaeraceae bacterium]|nr:hypothetical protein [Tepidisphaeraceae bacterium]